MRTPRWFSGSQDVPGTSPITGRRQAAPHGTRWYATAPVRVTLLPPTQHHVSLRACPLAPRETHERKMSLPRGHKVGTAQGQYGPPARSAGRQGNANSPSASQLSRGAARCPTPGLPAALRQGLPPSLHRLLPQAHTLGLLFWPLHHRQVPPERWEEWGLGLLRREWVGQH